jgi:hypothetical protein
MIRMATGAPSIAGSTRRTEGGRGRTTAIRAGRRRVLRSAGLAARACDIRQRSSHISIAAPRRRRVAPRALPPAAAPDP